VIDVRTPTNPVLAHVGGDAGDGDQRRPARVSSPSAGSS
jgi:hypothetical protein